MPDASASATKPPRRTRTQIAEDEAAVLKIAEIVKGTEGVLEMLEVVASGVIADHLVEADRL